MRRISVTELETFQKCSMRHYYRYERRLRHAEVPEESPYMLIGSAVAAAVEQALMLVGDGDRRKERAMGLVGVSLDEALAKDARAALGQVPGWIWQVQVPLAEDKLVVSYEDVNVEVVGKPDLWYVESDDEGQPMGVHVVEFKTSPKPRSELVKRLLSYEMWGVQAVRYAVLLHDKYEGLRDLPFYRQHILLSQRGVAVPEGHRYIVAPTALDTARADMLRLAQAMDEDPIHHFSTGCDWCPYGEVCFGWLTGAEAEGIIKEKYVSRGE